MTSTHEDASRRYARPLVPMAIALMAGIAAGAAAPGWRPATGAVAIAALVLLAVRPLRRRSARWAPWVLLFALGHLTLQSALHPHIGSDHLLHFAGRGPVWVMGRVEGLPRQTAYWLKPVVAVEAAGIRPDRMQRTRGRLTVSIAAPAPKIRPGDRIGFRAKIRKLKNFNNPGGFDYVRHMACRGIRATAYVRGPTVNVSPAGRIQSMSTRIDRTRMGLAEWMSRRAGSPDSAGLLRALLIGDRRGVGPDLREQFNRAGIGHLLAISGLHIGIVAAAAFFVLTRLLVFCPVLLRRAWVRKTAAMLALIPVIGYGLLAGMSPSTRRAVIMVSVFLFAILADRDADPMNTLALAALVILVADPSALLSVSFQLSFAAVLAILIGLRKTATPAGKRLVQLPWPLNRLVLMVLVSLLALLGTLPLTLYHFNRVSVIGPVMNLAAIPLIGGVAVPIGLSAVCLAPFCEPAAGAGLAVADAVLRIVLRLTACLEALPVAPIPCFTPTPVEIGLFYGLIGSAMHLRQSRTARRLFLVGLLAVGIDTVWWLQHRFWHPDLRVTVIDVGQGSAALVELPKGRCLLVDGGGFPDNSVFDVGRRVLAPLLWHNRIGTIDTVILSHPNSDHLNGLLFVLNHFNVRRVLTTGDAARTFGYRRFLDIVTDNAIQMPDFDRVPKSWSVGAVQIDVLYPPSDFRQRRRRDRWRNTNNNSLVVRISMNTVSFLFPGDIMAPAERELAALHGDRLRSTFLLSPHHGSRTSSSLRFLNAARPEWVIVSSGRKSSGRFPHPTVVERYRKQGLRVLRTDTHGAVTVRTDGTTYAIETHLPFTRDASNPGQIRKGEGPHGFVGNGGRSQWLPASG